VKVASPPRRAKRHELSSLDALAPDSRRRLLLASCAALLPGVTSAQPASRPRLIGVLGVARPNEGGSDPMRVFVAALAELGWVDGKTVVITWRGSEPRYDSFPEHARELVGLGVDLIVVNAGITAALAAKQATATIPILAIGVADPVKFGLVASMARPGGNVTGFAATTTDWGKYLELAREAVIGATRIAVIANPTNVGYADYVAANEAAARQLDLRLQMIPVSAADEFGAASDAMKRERADVLIFGPDRVFFAGMGDILERARATGIPVITPFRGAAERGALISFGLDVRDMLRNAAAYADRLLRGAKPAELPIQQPTRFELIVNLKTAKALNLRIPQSLRLRADELIE